MATLNFVLTLLFGLGLVIGAIILRIYLPTYFSEKAKNLAKKEDIEHLTRTVELVKHQFTAEVERLKAGLDRATHASKLQFDAEFAIYREIWEKLVAMRGAFFALRPFVTTVLPPEADQERRNQRIQAFNSAYNEFRISVYRNQPFYSQEVYSALSAIIDVCIDETLDYQDAPPSDYWKSVRQNKDKFLKQMDTACETIRSRFRSLVLE